MMNYDKPKIVYLIFNDYKTFFYRLGHICRKIISTALLSFKLIKLMHTFSAASWYKLGALLCASPDFSFYKNDIGSKYAETLMDYKLTKTQNGNLLVKDVDFVAAADC